MTSPLRHRLPAASVAILLGVALSAAECDNRQSCAALANLDKTVELGTGSSSFRTLADGDDLEITQGPQGGMHVWASARFSGVLAGDASRPTDPSNPFVEFSLRNALGVELAYSGRQRALKLREDGVIERVGEIVQFATVDIDEVAWQEATLELRLLDGCGTVLTDSRAVRLAPGCSEESTD